MMRLFWVDGRLSWPLLAAVGLLTISFLVLDFVWRMFVMPFETLLIYGAIGIAVGMILLAGLCRHFRSGRRAPPLRSDEAP